MYFVPQVLSVSQDIYVIFDKWTFVNKPLTVYAKTPIKHYG